MVTVTAEDGFVATPDPVADYAASYLFGVEAPTEDDRILYPGAGTGNLAAAVERYGSVRDLPCPDGVAVEADPDRAEAFRDRFRDRDGQTVPELSAESRRRLTPRYPPDTTSADAPVSMDVKMKTADFLLNPPEGEFDYILANPPYLRYSAIDADKRDRYRDRFDTAEGQFDLYMPFVEQMLDLLADDGWLAFLAPVKYLTLDTAAPLRTRMRRESPEGFVYLLEESFPDHTVSTSLTLVQGDASLDPDGSFWLEPLYDYQLAELLNGLGVEEDAMREAGERYYAEFEQHRRHLRARRRTKGADGGYNPSVDPQANEDYQAELGRWS